MPVRLTRRALLASAAVVVGPGGDPAVALGAAWVEGQRRVTALAQMRARLERRAEVRPGHPLLAALLRRAVAREEAAEADWERVFDRLLAARARTLPGIAAKLDAAAALLPAPDRRDMPWQLVASARADLARLHPGA